MAEPTAPKQPAHLRDDLKWKEGQSGNPAGRPKGARNKLGEAFVKALQKDFDEHGVAAIQVVRAEKPDQYLKVIASLLPKEHRVSLEDQFNEMTDDELAERIRQLASTLAPFLDGGVGGAAEGEQSPAGSQLTPRVH